MIFDVHVVDTDAPSHCSHSPQAVLQSAEVKKKRSAVLVLYHFAVVLMVYLH